MANSERLHSLDAVRGAALLLGIVFHAGFSFVPGMIAGVWATADSSPSTAIGGLVFVAHIFRMSLFFFLAGFFGRVMLERKGARGFWADRAKRILVPMIVGWAVLYPAIAAVWVWGITRYYAVAAPPVGLEAPEAPPLAFPMTHLWFLYVLLLLYGLVAGARSAVARFDRGGTVAALADRVVATLVRSGAAAFALALPLALLLAAQEKWLLYFGIPTPDSSLLPPLASFVGYATAFAFGWLVNRQPELLANWRASWPLHLAGALAATAACLWIAGPAPDWIPETDAGTKLGFAIAYALAVWCWVFAIVGAALRFLAAESPARRYVADASYWLYLAHLPVVAFFQVLVAPLPWHWSVKFPLVLAASLALLFANYHLFVRFTFLGEVLNGRKRARSRRAPASAPAAPTNRLSGAVPASAAAPAKQPEVLAELVGVRKRYGRIVALDGLDLSVRRGELLAVLGPNGAGKTTAISAWLGLVGVDEGEVRLLGRSPHDVDARREVGILMQEAALAPALRVREIVDLAASYYPSPLATAETLALTRTAPLAGRFGTRLSGGQKRLVQFAVAICGRPRLLFLDEPTAGLDVEAREAIWAILRELRAQGCSIVLTTHYLEEAEALADRVAVVRQGRVIALGTVDEVRSIVSRKTIRCATAVGVDEVRAWPHVVDARRGAQRLEIVALDAESVVRRLLASDGALTHLEVREAGLAEAFSELTKEAA